MSGVFHPNKVTYFPVAKALFKSGMCAELSYSSVVLYTYVCYLSQEKSKATVVLRNEELKKITGLTPNTVAKSQRELGDAGLMLSQANGRGVRYTLCNPETGDPLLESKKGGSELIDFDHLDEGQLSKYFMHHLDSAADTRNGLEALCPFHSDHRSSLNINLKNGGAWRCHACLISGKLVAFEQEMAKLLGAEISSKVAYQRILAILVETGAIEATQGEPEAVYTYTNAVGEPVFDVLRYAGKKFRQRRPDPTKEGHYFWDTNGVTKPLYRLPSIAEARVVIVLEGEKDVDNLLKLDLKHADMDWLRIAVTTNPEGAGKWRPEYSRCLKNKKVAILGDNDYLGQKHAQDIATALTGIASETRLLQFPPESKDVTEFLTRYDAAALVDLIGSDWVSRPFHIDY